jgi:hypothetical protein
VPTNLDNLLILKQRWGASVAAMMMRLHALGLLSDEDKLALFKRRSARWGSKAEPGDDNWSPELPRLLRRTVELLVNEGILPIESLARHLGFSPLDIQKLCSLRSNYFEAPGEIVDLATLRTARSNGQVATRPDKTPGSVLSFLNFKK